MLRRLVYLVELSACPREGGREGGNKKMESDFTSN
jgi:hypothetical protein